MYSMMSVHMTAHQEDCYLSAIDDATTVLIVLVMGSVKGCAYKAVCALSLSLSEWTN